jgi:SAM-dependent methyltransferase
LGDKGEIKKLQLGCGFSKKEGYIHLDSAEVVKPDILWDLNKFPYPFEDNSIDEILAYSILEHLDDVVKVMEELHRIMKPKAILKVGVPYWDGFGFASDPTHKHMFTEYTFEFFSGKADYSFITQVRFNITELKMVYHPRFKWVPKFIKKRLRFILKEVVVGLFVTMEAEK